MERRRNNLFGGDKGNSIYASQYVTIESQEDDNRVYWSNASSTSSYYTTIEASTDGTTWTTYRSAIQTNTLVATLNTGDKLYLRGSGNYFKGNYLYYYNYINPQKEFIVYGNVMSLLYGDDFADKTELQANSTSDYHHSLACFFRSTKVTDASNLVLPATTLINGCYHYMFSGCTRLSAMPELPATTLVSSCYQDMFSGCTSLTKTTPLPATTLAQSCYYKMFYGCTSLVKAPFLPATTLAQTCYSQMFQGCTSLTKVPSRLPATTLAGSCYSNMFNGCTSLEKAPILPATTLVSSCYSNMFQGCTKLNYIKCLAVSNGASNCTSSWVDGVAQYGTFVSDPNVLWIVGTSGVPIRWELQYDPDIPIDYSKQYLTIESTSSANEVSWIANNSSYTRDILVSSDGTDWTTYTSSESPGTLIGTLSKGTKMYIKASGFSDSYISRLSLTGTFKVYGNAMSLVYGDSFIGKTTMNSKRINGIFYGCTGLTDASNLIFPATTLAESCYSQMFYGCTSLTATPELPATTLANSCYSSMFKECTSLVTAPELPATTLAQSCYSSMFNGCTSLVTAPELNAIYVENSCYYYMFNGCSKLNRLKCLCACSYHQYFLTGVASTGTLIKNPNVTWGVGGYDGVPSGWTVQDDETIEEDFAQQYFTIESTSDNNTISLKAASTTNKTVYVLTSGGRWTSKTSTTGGTGLATLNRGDKVYIFGSNNTYASSSSDYVSFASTGDFKVYGNTMSLVNGSYYYRVSYSGTTSANNYMFLRLLYNTRVTDAQNLIFPITDLYNCYYGYYEMFSGCTSLVTAPELPATRLYQYCYSHMFYGCTSLVTAPELPATTLNTYCYQCMFYNCTSLVTAPQQLPATTLAESCYSQMFSGCSNLENAPDLPATSTADYCYSYMFRGCSKINRIKCLSVFASPSSSSTNNWLSGVSATGTFIKNPNTVWPVGVSSIPEGWTVQDDETIEEDFEQQPLTIVSLEDNNTISWKCSTSDSGNYKSIYVSTDDRVTWVSKTSSDSGTTLATLNKNQKLYIYSTTGVSSNTSSGYYNYISTTKNFNVQGNACSIGQSSFYKCSSTSYIGHLFYNNTNLIDASNLYIGPIRNGYSCYYMFYGCTNMIIGPTVHAGEYWSGSDSNQCAYMFCNCRSMTRLKEFSTSTSVFSDMFYGMFSGCTSFNMGIVISGVNARSCCSMFQNCTSLTITPEFGFSTSTILSNSCFAGMFSGCTSLTTAPTKLSNFYYLAASCYSQMFYGCTSLVTAPQLPATTLMSNCYYQMFKNCTSLTTAPRLSALTLAQSCYNQMFSGCSNLSSVTCLATDISASGCTTDWLKNVNSSGTFYKKSTMTGWTTGTSGIPSGWTTVDVS